MTLTGPGRVLARTLIAIVAVLALAVPTTAVAIGGYYQLTTTSVTKEEAIPADTTALSIETVDASVVVEIDDELDAPVVAHRYEGPARQVSAPEVSRDGDAARIDVPSHNERRWWLRSRDWVTVSLPSEYAEDLDLEVDNRVGAIDVSGDYGSLRAATAAGVVNADVTAGAVDLTTRTGVVNVEGAMDTLDVETRTGFVYLDRVAVATSLKAETTSGAVYMGLNPAQLPVDGVEARAKSGAVDVDVPREDQLSGTGFTGYSVTVSTEAGPAGVEIAQSQPGEGVVPITASTTSGPVTVSYLDPGEWGDGDAGDRWDGDGEDPYESGNPYGGGPG